MYPNSVIYRSGIFVHEQVKKLAELGFDIDVIAPIPIVIFPINLFNDRYRKYKNVPKFELFEKIKVHHPRFLAIPNGYLIQYWAYTYLLGVKKVIRKILNSNQQTLIHVHGGLPDDYGAYLLAKYFNLKTILTVHGASVYSALRNKQQFVKTKKAIENSDLVVAVSNVVKRRIEKYTERKGDINVIYNGINFHSKEKTIENDQIQILTVASLIERKGIIYAIKAVINLINKYNNIVYNIIGNGPMEKELKQFVAKYGAESRIRFLNFMTHDKILDHMNKSDIFVLPSWNEAFGVVYIEAMSFKVPIIGSKEEGISDIIIDGENGYLCEIKNTAEITEKLDKLICNSEHRQNLGKLGYESIKEMTWMNNARKNAELYEELIKN